MVRVGGSAQQQGSESRVRLVLASCWLLVASCVGGPHPLPPGGGRAVTNGPPTIPVLGAPADMPSGLSAAGAASAPVTQPTSSNPAGAVTGLMPPPAANSGGTGATVPAMGAAAGTGAAAPATGAAGAAGAPATPPTSTSTDDTLCGAQTFLPRAPATQADNVLFVVDWSADMAQDFQGTPRWQVTGHALVSALQPLASDALEVGAVFYPSSAPAPAACLVPGLCPAQSAGTCSVSSMSASDQLSFQSSVSAVAALSGQPELYQAISGSGVPLSESIQRAASSLASAQLHGRTRVVIIANAQPSCAWNQTEAVSALAAWNGQRQITTRVIALPGTSAQVMSEFSALAQAGGQDRVLTPQTPAELQNMLQSIVLGSLDSCTLALDPPVVSADASQVHVLVGVQGSERELPRMSPGGETLWTISQDGAQLSLLGSACSAAQGGEYDSLRVAVGCVHAALVE